MAENQMTHSLKILVKILLYALGAAVVIFVVGFLLRDKVGGDVMGLAAIPTIIAVLTFIAFLISLARSKN